MVPSKLTLAVVLLCGLAACQLTAATTCTKTSQGKPLVSVTKQSKTSKNKIYSINEWTFPQFLKCTSYPTIKVCYHDVLRFTSMTAAHYISVTNSAKCPNNNGLVVVRSGTTLTPKKPATTKIAGAYLKKGQKKGAVWFFCPVPGHCRGGMIMKMQVVC